MEPVESTDPVKLSQVAEMTRCSHRVPADLHV